MRDARPAYPFTAIVGQELMKLALTLNAINPRLGGALIRGEKGTAKSTAVRALANLLPETLAVQGCAYGCDPAAREVCEDCASRRAAGNGELPVSPRRVRVVDLPVGATEDRVVGSLDLERAVSEGVKRFEPGVLARANGNILYVDEVNLLDDHVVDALLDAAAMGVNVVEREGVSHAHPARFTLIGTMNPEEGELRPQLLDRFGLCVEVAGVADMAARVDILTRLEAFEAGPESFCESWSAEEEALRRTIREARERLPRVTASGEVRREIARASLELGVDGHRADLTMLKAAKTLAALRGREEVEASDVREAATLALPHRMRRKPFQSVGVDASALGKLFGA